MGAFASLSRGVKIFLAVDVVLVLVLVVAAIVVLGGGPDDGDPAATAPSTSAAPAATDEGSDGPSSGDEPTSVETSDEATTFASPSGNISCTMSPDGVTCQIANKQFDVPPAEGCTGTTGHTIVLSEADGVTTPCVEGPAPVAASADTPVLDYGRSQQVAGYTCTSGTDGMACVVADSGVGFRVATAALTNLP
ncbi:DUF6636 domain-containing protein [Cellulomonas triticagri]|uniref:Uncharacterized protein n=1 Tax=Cellulomonas triticagri TaxID=2483352 RepID=A0A3M2JLR8_9CELL|nr:DUF6636 domain-containing protein [Cellulomonas triticagri]RMI14084.1 hypothetical protein EBM89_01815 [Cellulomonas triticagri]